MSYNQDQDYSDEISRFTYMHSRLWEKWEKAKALVKEHQKENKIDRYKILPSNRIDEFRFRIFNIDCYMKFWPIIRRGEPSTGIIQYGVLVEDEEVGKFRRRKVDLIEFYDRGVIRKPDGVPVMVGAFEEAPSYFKNVHAYMICKILSKC